ncbi:MAG: right-handed parallel beta-helix repeat-containing protein [Candidatus Hydrogenedentota bacterium]
MPRNLLCRTLSGFAIAALAAGVFLAGTPHAEGNEYYVAPHGDDASSGAEDAPWASLEHAGAVAEAGDTVVFLPGDYEGVLAPENSGTEEAPIVFKAEQRRTARFVGRGDGVYPIRLDGLEHVRIEGVHVEPAERGGRWLRMEDCRHIVLADCLFEKGYSGMPFHIIDSRNIWVQDSVLRKNAFNMARISDSEQVVFEGNAVSRAGHSPLQIYPPGSNAALVVRGNVFHAAWGRPFEFFTTQDVLFEGNIITNAYNGGRSASSNAKFAVQGGIFRFNRVFRNWGGALHFYPWADDTMEAIRAYHNVFHGNTHYGFSVRGGGQTRDVLFQNNILAENDPHGAWTQLQVSGESPESVEFRSNALWAGEPDRDQVIHWGGQGYSADAVGAKAWREDHGEVFHNTRDAQPGFVDAAQYQHGLSEDSPLRNAGSPLAHAQGDGEEDDVLPVTDPRAFYDGYGIPGEEGDLVAVGTPHQLARVTEVDSDEGVLILDREMTWADGDPVSLPWSGAKPDIGVHEHGADGRPSVEVRVTPFQVEPGEPVAMEAVLHGIPEVESIQWRLGDGTLVRDKTSFTHEYAAAYDYPIRVRVTGGEGRIHRGVGYAVVEEPANPGEPLLHSTFGADDQEWWWRWQSYRPMPAAWERVLVLEEGDDVPPPWSHPRGDNRVIPPEEDNPAGSGWLRAYAPEDGGRLPVRVHPRRWAIDTYPRIRIRYRLEPDTPVGVYVRAFPTPETGGREVWLASSPATARAEDDPGLPRLQDDGEWHVLELDARDIRETHPEVDVLEGLRFWAEDTGRVEEGHALELDEVVISPRND